MSQKDYFLDNVKKGLKYITLASLVPLVLSGSPAQATNSNNYKSDIINQDLELIVQHSLDKNSEFKDDVLNKSQSNLNLENKVDNFDLMNIENHYVNKINNLDLNYEFNKEFKSNNNIEEEKENLLDRLNDIERDRYEKTVPYQENIKNFYEIGKKYFEKENLSIDFDINSIYSLIYVESTYDDSKISSSKDYYLMQVNDSVNTELKRVHNLNPENNYFFSETQKYLKEIYDADEFDKNLHRTNNKNSFYNIRAGISYLFLVNEYLNKSNEIDFNSVSKKEKEDLIMWGYNRGPYEIENIYSEHKNNWKSFMPHFDSNGDNIRQDGYEKSKRIYESISEKLNN
ncbi:MAG: hypothetical protein ACOCRX_04975 [Candidatus Woesearchaeota archaeon]